MSELNWNWVYYPYLDAPDKQAESALKAGYIKVVDKSEADKVIALQKYKRCLAMKRWCASGSLVWMADPADDVLHKSDFYDRWKLRWMELAEKFKEAK